MRARMKPAVILLSGGMDSTTLLHYVRQRLGIRRVHAVSFFYGQKHAREIEAAQWQARKAGVVEHRIVDIRFLEGLVAGASALTDRRIEIPDLARLTRAQRRQPPTYVPNRNMILLSLAAAYAEAVGAADVFYGAQAQDEYGYWDCTREFVDRMNRVLLLNRGRKVRIRAPLVDLRKADELRIGLGLGVDYRHTWSCYRGGRRPCGRCPACGDRAKAFREVGIEDPVDAPPNLDLDPDYEREIQRRVRMVREGKAQGRPAAAVFREIEAKHG